MPELERLYHLSPRVMGAGFPEDIDPNSALDPANRSIIGDDEHEVPVDQVNPAEIPFSWRDFYLHVREAFRNQEYNLTVSGITDPQGNPLGPYTWQWMPMQPVPVYPPAGIMQPWSDGNYYGQRIGIQILTKEEMIEMIKGVLPDDTEYPFTPDPSDPSRWILDTSDVPDPSEDFKIRPVPLPGHEDDFEPGELDDLYFPLIPPPWPSRIEDVLMSNETRPGAGTFYPIDTIGSKLFADADQIRGVKVMIFRRAVQPRGGSSTGPSLRSEACPCASCFLLPPRGEFQGG